MQINPDRAEPEVLCVQKHEFRFFCAREFFCWFDASYYPFAQNLYQMFEDAVFVAGNSSCRSNFIQRSQSLIEIQESTPRNIVCFGFVKNSMVMHKRFISNIYIQVALTAKDQLFHNLIGVPDCEVAGDGMNHLCKIPSELGSLVDSSFQ